MKSSDDMNFPDARPPARGVKRRTMDLPPVTVAIMAVSSGDRIRKPLLSVLVQDYPNLEVLVADSTSDDATFDVCNEIARTHPQMSCFNHSAEIGVFENFEFLLSRASGTYFLCLSDNDTLAPGIISRYVSFMDEHPSYSLVSGVIGYKDDHAAKEFESGFSLEYDAPAARLIAYYGKVVLGGMFHGLVRTDVARRVRLERVLCSDWHFAAGLAYLGKVKMLDSVGYFRGAALMAEETSPGAAAGDAAFHDRHPHVRIASDAFRLISRRSPLFNDRSTFNRYALALAAFLAILIRRYVLGGASSGDRVVRSAFSGLTTQGRKGVVEPAARE